MKIQTNKLKEIFNSIKPGITIGQETTEQSSQFVFKNNTVYSYNDEIFVKREIDLEIEIEEGAVSARELLLLLNKFNTDTCSFVIKDNELRIRSGRSKAGIRLDSEIYMPIDDIHIPKRKKWTKLPKEFKEAISGTIFSTSTDSEYPILSVIHCFGNIIESMDNVRATKYFFSEDIFPQPILIPSFVAKHLICYDNIQSYYLTEDWVLFKINKETIFGFRIFEGEYPDLSEIFLEESEGRKIYFPSNIKDVINKATVFVEGPDEQEKNILVHLEKGKIRIRAEGDNGWFEESIVLKENKEVISFSINPKYFQQILNKSNSARIKDDKILFYTDEFQHILMLF